MHISADKGVKLASSYDTLNFGERIAPQQVETAREKKKEEFKE